MKSRLSKILKGSVIGALTLGLISCGNSENDKIADAQICLDKATSETALSCMDKVDGMTTPASELIRCSAYFVDQGFGEASRLANVAEKITDESNSGDGTMAALSFMAFSAQKYSKTRNHELSEASFVSCNASKSGGLIYLSSMSRIATTAMNLIGSYDPSTGVPPTEAEIKEILCDNPMSSETSAAIGSAAQAAYESNCLGKDISQDTICQQYKAAMDAGSTPEEIGTGLTNEICQP